MTNTRCMHVYIVILIKRLYQTIRIVFNRLICERALSNTQSHTENHIRAKYFSKLIKITLRSMPQQSQRDQLPRNELASQLQWTWASIFLRVIPILGGGNIAVRLCLVSSNLNLLKMYIFSFEIILILCKNPHQKLVQK